MSTPSAEKSDPALWKRIVAKVRRGTKGGDAGEWSARKAQLATAEYQKAGGGYAGGRKEDTHLAQWGEEHQGDAEKPAARRKAAPPEETEQFRSLHFQMRQLFWSMLKKARIVALPPLGDRLGFPNLAELLRHLPGEHLDDQRDECRRVVLLA